MKKILLLGAVFSMALTFSAYAQRTVTGKITDDEGIELPGVNVVVVGTMTGTVTDLEGEYSLTVPEGASLKYSFVGFEDQIIDVGSRSIIDVTMGGIKQLADVVVTALGIERKKDEDISSSTLVETDKVTRSGEVNLIQGLAGKTSGVLVTQSSGDPGAGARIQIRGQNTILGSSSPLIVVDGIPISNSTYGGNNGSDGGTLRGVVEQSRLNDIASSDIESMTVLKGAAAAAVWGTGAANGVIIIKTKNGSKGGGKFSADINASVGFDQINVEHEKQGLYGQGTGGKWSSNASGKSWGDKISSRSGKADEVDKNGAYLLSDQSGKKIYKITKKNSKNVYNDKNREQIFRTGVTQNYSVGLNFAQEGSSTYIGYSRLAQIGILNGPSDYFRNTFRINHSRKFSDWLSGRINASYTDVKSNRIQTGSNVNGLYLGYLRTSPDFDNTDYSGTYFKSPTTIVGTPNSHRSYRNRQIGEGAGIYNNPGWTINKQTNKNGVDRFIIAPELVFKLSDNISLTSRYGLDFYLDRRISYFPVNSSGVNGKGDYSRSDYSEKTENLNVFLSGNQDSSDDFKLNWIIGFMYDSKRYGRVSSNANQFLNPDPSKQLVANSTIENRNVTEANRLNKKNGGYYSLSFTLFKDLLLETAGRLERSAALTDLNFYPSVSLGYILTNNLIESDFLSFAKLRGSFGQIGIEPELYRNQDIFVASTSGDEGMRDFISGANYEGTFRRGSNKGNPNLKVEKITEIEAGTDLRFFKNVLSIGFTYYNRVNRDVILRLELPSSSGYLTQYKNGAQISNRGIEIDFNYSIVSNDNVEVDLFGNWTTYKNIVDKLPDVSRSRLNGFSGTSSVVTEGSPFAAIWGGRFERDKNGKLDLDENGFPQADKKQGVIGDPNPDWRGSLGMSASIKGVKLSFMFETSQGNDMWAGTKGILHHFGIDPNTAKETTATKDLKTFTGGIIKAGEKFRGNIKDFGGGEVALDEKWYSKLGGGFGPVGEQFVEDASWTKLREVSLSYSFPKSLLEGIGLSRAEIGVTGRNLLLFTKFTGVDPEVNLTGASKGRGLDYFTNPATRGILFNLNIGL